MSPSLQPGTVVWMDLTVPNAEEVRDFYGQLLGWQPSPVDMGDYHDFSMSPPGTEQAAAGVCHARGMNAAIPAYWMIYIVVEDLQVSLDRCVELGGQVIVGPQQLGENAHHAIVQDPAGAYFALYAPPQE